MGQRVTLSGHIQELFYGVPTFEQQQSVGARNWAAIQRLPEEDRWPFLTRGMFSRSPEVQADGPLVTTYRGRVLFFGGSFSSLHDDIDEWLAKFEALLRQLSWEHASVQVITEWVGHYHYHWEPRAGADVASECVQMWDRRDVRLHALDPAAPT